MVDVEYWQVARMADTPSTPEGKDTEGAKWLMTCFYTAEELYDDLQGYSNEEYDIRISDLAMEYADGLVPIYTSQLWNIWVDCGGYNHEGEYRDFTSHGDTGDMMNRIAMADCYEWANNVLYNGVKYIRQERS